MDGILFLPGAIIESAKLPKVAFPAAGRTNGGETIQAAIRNFSKTVSGLGPKQSQNILEHLG